MKFNLTVLINNAYGGFSIPVEMVNWLHENKGWKLPDDSDEDSKFYRNFGKCDYHIPKDSSVEFRSNKELIEAYKVCMKERESDSSKSYFEKQRHTIFTLKLVDVEINISVEDYSDGYERITVNSSY